MVFTLVDGCQSYFNLFKTGYFKDKATGTWLGSGLKLAHKNHGDSQFEPAVVSPALLRNAHHNRKCLALISDLALERFLLETC